jgi:hypothetical protein
MDHATCKDLKEEPWLGKIATCLLSTGWGERRAGGMCDALLFSHENII